MNGMCVWDIVNIVIHVKYRINTILMNLSAATHRAYTIYHQTPTFSSALPTTSYTAQPPHPPSPLLPH